MDIQQQVVSVEQAKRLETLLGENIKSAFYWLQNSHDENQYHLAMPCAKGFVTIDPTDGEVYTESGGNCYNAFTVSELLIMSVSLIITLTKEELCNTAQILAGKLISKLENKTITPEEVNNRLLNK